MQQNAICSKAVHCANMTFTRRTEVNLSDGRYHRSARGEGGLVTETQWHLQFSRKGKRSQALCLISPVSSSSSVDLGLVCVCVYKLDIPRLTFRVLISVN